MVLANIALKKARRREIEDGRRESWKEGWVEGWKIGWEEGIERANSRWIIWNLRRQIAEANGEPFDEPPPAS